MSTANKDFAIVIPAFNEVGRIAAVIKKAKKYCKYIVVVDDGSIDETASVSRKAGACVVRHKINLGKGASLKTGVEVALKMGKEFVVVLDADGQHNPNHIPQFLAKIRGGKDIVFGTRDLAGKAPIIRMLGNKFASLLIMVLFGIYRKDILCGFMAFTKDAYAKIKWESTRYGIETEVVARTGKYNLKYDEVKIDTIYIDKYKGVSMIDALAILPSVFKWRLIN